MIRFYSFADKTMVLFASSIDYIRKLHVFGRICGRNQNCKSNQTVEETVEETVKNGENPLEDTWEIEKI